MKEILAPCSCSPTCGSQVPPASILRRAEELRNLSDTERHEFCFSELRTLADRVPNTTPTTYSTVLK